MIDTSKKFLVAGAGKSGIGSVNLLLKTGADVSLYDGKEDLEKEALYEKLYEKKEIPLILGNITKEDIERYQNGFLIVSRHMLFLNLSTNTWLI